ncbi:hypothetical protein BHQ29_09655 [Pseudomonas sp. LPH1]|nr:hypothetical protein BHQ29_09655 [Pseudomonas sp. LPH1]
MRVASLEALLANHLTQQFSTQMPALRCESVIGDELLLVGLNSHVADMFIIRVVTGVKEPHEHRRGIAIMWSDKRSPVIVTL